MKPTTATAPASLVSQPVPVANPTIATRPTTIIANPTVATNVSVVWKFVVQSARMSSSVPSIEPVHSMNAPTISPAAPRSVSATRAPTPAALPVDVP